MIKILKFLIKHTCYDIGNFYFSILIVCCACVKFHIGLAAVGKPIAVLLTKVFVYTRPTVLAPLFIGRYRMQIKSLTQSFIHVVKIPGLKEDFLQFSHVLALEF